MGKDAVGPLIRYAVETGLAVTGHPVSAKVAGPLLSRFMDVAADWDRSIRAGRSVTEINAPWACRVWRRADDRGREVQRSGRIRAETTVEAIAGKRGPHTGYQARPVANAAIMRLSGSRGEALRERTWRRRAS
jgi:hypothetical protein